MNPTTPYLDPQFSWITPTVFIEFANDKRLNLACNKCPSPNGFLVDTGWNDGFIPRSSAFASTPANYVDLAHSKHLACVRVLCTDCGHLDLYSMYVVQMWRANKNARQERGLLFDE
ncbi:Zn-finger nucleic acid-binding protein [Rhizobium leguminosarum]|nr:Zn-finger nucleic acid-binding protein [Rhizobium leguminosarum]